jgi:hypothetical protein
MKTFIICLALHSTLLAFTPATASPLDDKVNAFKKAIQDEIATKPIKDEPAPNEKAAAVSYNDTNALMASLDQIPKQMDNPNDVHNVEIQIRQLLAAYTFPPVQKAGQDLINQVNVERKAREDAVAVQVQELLKRLADKVGSAQKASDLDGILIDLQKFLDDKYGFNSANPANYQQIAGALEFGKLWQNYLSHSASDQGQLALNDLRNIDQNNSALGIVPRSQILDRLTAETKLLANTPSPAIAIIKNIKSLDEMEPALKQLSQLPQNDSVTSRAYSGLIPLVQLYTSVKSGLPQTINFNFVSNASDVSVSPALQIQLLNFVLQHYCDSYKGTPPAADEKPDAFINRVIADAIRREDWPLLRKAVTGQAYLNRNSALALPATNNIVAGLDNLLSGVNEEAASQFAMAVGSYQKALKISDPTIPAKWIGARLADMQKNHPKEFEEGVQMETSSSASKAFSNRLPTPATPPSVPATK